MTLFHIDREEVDNKQAELERSMALVTCMALLFRTYAKVIGLLV
jgi:hypothetical protein